MGNEESHHVLLIGAPNIGKSVIFNALTGMRAQVANYQGTTIESGIGRFTLPSGDVTLVDVPGTYSLVATCEAEQIAVDMLCGKYRAHGGMLHHCAGCPHSRQNRNLVWDRSRPDAVLCVLDALNLESSLYLALQVVRHAVPIVFVLNRMDLARERGLSIDVSTLARELGQPVVETVAITRHGIDTVKTVLSERLATNGGCADASDNDPEPIHQNELWTRIHTLVGAVVRDENRITWRRRIGEALSVPWPGFPLAVAVMGLAFAFIVGAGMGLRRFILLPVLRGTLFPLIVAGVESALPAGFWQRVLVGEYGFLIKGIEWPFALVLPYVVSFYLVMSFLEDSGYMPRLAGLLDGLFLRMGLPGSAIIPLILGYGCGIPAILSTRGLRNRKERLLVSTMICLAVPCISQTGAFIALLGAHSFGLMILVFGISVVFLVLCGMVLDRMIPGARQATLWEIPEFLKPQSRVIVQKVAARIRHYLFDGAIPMMVGIGFAAVLYESGLMEQLGRLTAPLVSGWLRLPRDAAVPLVLGILRRELTVLPLLDMDLSTIQLLTGSVVALFYIPCIAMMATLAKEFGVRFAVAILVGTTLFALFFGGLVAQAGLLLGAG